jgi:hypothetical protein
MVASISTKRRITEQQPSGTCREASAGKEKAMDKEKMSDGVTRYFQGSVRDFTPITVSADFGALERLKNLGGDEESNRKESEKNRGWHGVQPLESQQ